MELVLRSKWQRMLLSLFPPTYCGSLGDGASTSTLRGAPSFSGDISESLIVSVGGAKNSSTWSRNQDDDRISDDESFILPLAKQIINIRKSCARQSSQDELSIGRTGRSASADAAFDLNLACGSTDFQNPASPAEKSAEDDHGIGVVPSPFLSYTKIRNMTLGWITDAIASTSSIRVLRIRMILELLLIATICWIPP